MDRETLIAYIAKRLPSQSVDRNAEDLPGWLEAPYVISLSEPHTPERDGRVFDLRVWQGTGVEVFGGRTPRQIIDSGTDAERSQLALLVDAIAALRDGAFS